MTPLEFQRARVNAEAAAVASDASRLANELQRHFPEVGRTAALREAERIQRKYGLGMAFEPVEG